MTGTQGTQGPVITRLVVTRMTRAHNTGDNRWLRPLRPRLELSFNGET